MKKIIVKNIGITEINEKEIIFYGKNIKTEFNNLILIGVGFDELSLPDELMEKVVNFNPLKFKENEDLLKYIVSHLQMFKIENTQKSFEIIQEYYNLLIINDSNFENISIKFSDSSVLIKNCNFHLLNIDIINNSSFALYKSKIKNLNLYNFSDGEIYFSFNEIKNLEVIDCGESIFTFEKNNIELYRLLFSDSKFNF